MKHKRILRVVVVVILGAVLFLAWQKLNTLQKHKTYRNAVTKAFSEYKDFQDGSLANSTSPREVCEKTYAGFRSGVLCEYKGTLKYSMSPDQTKNIYINLQKWLQEKGITKYSCSDVSSNSSVDVTTLEDVKRLCPVRYGVDYYQFFQIMQYYPNATIVFDLDTETGNSFTIDIFSVLSDTL